MGDITLALTGVGGKESYCIEAVNVGWQWGCTLWNMQVETETQKDREKNKTHGRHKKMKK